jgi:hypothetical protein
MGQSHRGDDIGEGLVFFGGQLAGTKVSMSMDLRMR